MTSFLYGIQANTKLDTLGADAAQGEQRGSHGRIYILIYTYTYTSEI